MALFRSLGHRPFALMWGGQTVSRLGDSLYTIALAWWVLEKTGSAAAMGSVLVFRSVPMVLFLLLGGVTVDRLPRLRLMLASDLLRGLLVSAVAVLAWVGRLEIWLIYLTSALFGLVDAFFMPVYAATVPQVAPAEVLPSANSLSMLSSQLSGVVGPALGAALVALGGTPLAFGLDALSFFISSACLVPLQANGQQPARTGDVPSGVLHDLREGLRLVLASPWLWITIGIAGLTEGALVGPFNISMPFLIKDTMHLDVGALGLVYSANSVGVVSGAVWLGRFKRLRRRGLTAYAAWVLCGLMTLTLGLPLGLAGLLAAGFALGIATSIYGLIWVNARQELVPRASLGRVASIDYLGSFLLLPVSYGLTGWATGLLGPRPVFWIGGAFAAGLAALGLAQPAIRKLD